MIVSDAENDGFGDLPTGELILPMCMSPTVADITIYEPMAYFVWSVGGDPGQQITNID